MNASPSMSPGRRDLAPSSAADVARLWYRSSQGAADRAMWVHVIRLAACGDSGLEADQWFPVSPQLGRARREAAAAIAVCRACRVRAQCLELSLRHWDIGQHGVWGGLVAAERAALRRRVFRWPTAPGRRPGLHHDARERAMRVQLAYPFPIRLTRDLRGGFRASLDAAAETAL